MKRFWTAVAILAILAYYVVCSTEHISDVASAVCGNIDLCENNLINTNYANCEKYFKNAYSDWKNESAVLGIILRHTELDAITINFEEAKGLLKNKNYQDFLDRLYTIRIKIKLLDYVEKIAADNVF